MSTQGQGARVSGRSGLKSAIYTGYVRHRRFLPVKHAFKYRLFMMYVDLDELPTLLDGFHGWSYEQANVASFYRRFYFGNAGVPLAEAVRGAAAEKLGYAFTGPVRMLTHFRYLGFCYNPVTFYFCFDAADQQVEAIVAEITNTPWGERHAYFLDGRTNETPVDVRFRWHFPKVFHVSPFMPMNVMYDWRFTTPGDTLNVHMADEINGEKYFDATLTLTRKAISQTALNQVLLAYPAMTLKAVAGIHWQAFRLWLKRTPYYEHPKPMEERNRHDSTI